MALQSPLLVVRVFAHGLENDLGLFMQPHRAGPALQRRSGDNAEAVWQVAIVVDCINVSLDSSRLVRFGEKGLIGT